MNRSKSVDTQSCRPRVVIRDAVRCLAGANRSDDDRIAYQLEVLDCQTSTISMKMRREISILKNRLSRINDCSSSTEFRLGNVARRLDF